VVIEFAVRAVGETVGDISAAVGERHGASSAVEVVSGVCSVGLFPDQPQAVDVVVVVAPEGPLTVRERTRSRAAFGSTTKAVKLLKGL
jgi:hypothetical protein